MVTPVRLRDEQRGAREAAIIDAAWRLFASRGPDGASLRDVAGEAGCSHALVARYYGSKEGLVAAVAGRLVDEVAGITDREGPTGSQGDPLVALLATARRDRPATQLLIRTALGDLPHRGFPGGLQVEWLLSQTTVARRAAAGRRRRLCAYAAASLLLGFVTFEGFVVAGTALGALPPRRRDLAVAGAARHLLDLAAQRRPRLARRHLAGPDVARSSSPGPDSSRQALLRSAIALFAARGPASVSVRDVARHAGCNQGLIYRHFGSKDALLAEALEQGLSGLFPAALAGEGFDFDAMSWLIHHASPGPRLIARTLVDDIDIAAVRRQFPVMRRLLDLYGRVPTGAGPGDLSDPRVAVAATAAMAFGSAVWGPYLRPALDLAGDGGVEAALSDLARELVAAPLHRLGGPHR